VTDLLGWLDRPDSGRGIRFAAPDGTWDLWTYTRLAALVRRSAAALRQAGVRPGDVVTIVEPTGPRFVGLLFGSMLAGAVASPLAPPPAFGDRDRYGQHLHGVLATAVPRLVVHDPTLPEVGALCRAAGVGAVESQALLHSASGTAPAEPGEIALLQFTSGTSGRVRGVRVPPTALAANVAAIARWLRMTPDDATASWLPVHHDMGLIGCLLAPVATGSDLWLMSPGDFVRRPLRYLECFGRQGTRLSAMPAFGLDHIVRRVPADRLAGMDLSAWRALILGAERIPAPALDAFLRLCGPAGLRREALLPAYGLAENTLSVTGLPLATGWRAVEHAGTPVVSCGRPLTGVRVRVVDEAGGPVPEGQVGEIVVGGTSVAAGYAGSAGRSTFRHGELHTGDAGFLQDGELFVLGRWGDSVKVRGRTVFAEDVDAAVHAACRAPAGRIAALLGQVGDEPQVVLVLAHPRPEWPALAEAAAREVAEGTAVRTVVVPAGAIPRTSSGKPRRRQMWATHVTDPAPPAAHPAPGPAAR
jgi:acyl-CoA synthetase (AMP-forming)/AMP-acid ligase II